MGTVGLNFGSPTSGQGFDVNATVTQIVGNLQNAETPYKTHLTALQGQDTVFSNIGGLLSTLSTDITSLTDFQGVLASKQGSSSDPNTLALTNASSTATAGTHTVTVSALAQTSSTYSSAIPSGDTLSGSLSIAVGSGAAQTISVDPQRPTLAGLAAAINSAGVGVVASVISQNGSARLSLVSSSSGAGGTIALSGGITDNSNAGAGITFTTAQPGQDAQITVDGVPYSSSSNTVSSAIPGITFQLLNTNATPVQVAITNDTSTVSTAVQKVVTDYNAVVKAVNQQEGKDASGNPEPLYGSPVLASLQQKLQQAIGFTQASGIRNATELGIETNNDGTLTLNTDTLNSVLNSQYQNAVNFFQNSGSFGVNLASAVESAGTSQATGTLFLAERENSSEETDLNATVATLDANINAQKQHLTAELNSANETLQLLPSQLNSINEIYNAITGYNPRQN